MTARHPWRKVARTDGYFEGRGSVLGPDTSRRTRWWELTLEGCDHRVERTVRYAPRTDGYARSRGGTQHRSASAVLPAPKRVRCDRCPQEET
jgi:hypothetical protein